MSVSDDVDGVERPSEGGVMTSTTATTTNPDPARIEAFGAQLLGAYVGAATTAMVALGHKTGLFEAAATGPATSAELADRAGLSERHVREWLGSMVTAGVFTYGPTDRTYRLPLEHAFLLTGDTVMNQAVLAPMSVHLSSHVDGVAERFRTGGGVPYDEYRPEFTEAMDEIGRRQYDSCTVPDGKVTEVGQFDTDRQPRPVARVCAVLAVSRFREDRRVLRAAERDEG